MEHVPSTRVAFSSIGTTRERGGEGEGRKEGEKKGGRTIGNFSGQSPLTYKGDGEPGIYLALRSGIRSSRPVPGLESVKRWVGDHCSKLITKKDGFEMSSGKPGPAWSE